MRFKNIFTFLSTLFNTFNKLIAGKEFAANFKDIENRLQICRACEHRRGDALKNMKCKICECKVRYKVRLASSRCPEGKWNSTDS